MSLDHLEPAESTGRPDQLEARARVASDGASDPGAAPARVTGEGSGHVAPATDDRELARRLHARDASALAELYRAHRRRAFGLAYRVLGDGAAAEDAVQAAFLALWERADRIGEHGRLDALVMTVVHRRAVDLARRRARAGHLEVVPSAGASEHAPDPAETIPDEHAQEAFARVLDDHSAQTRLVAALARLPEEQRTVVELAYFEGLTHRAIAERLGLPGGTVKSRLRLGLGHLRDALPARDNPGRREGRA
jgi:RNA polymerase sigma-70 factor (ECF subfamily)